jgi:glycosyltransferase involved in cell wall biosynthesis
MSVPLVSILIPTYNAEQWIARTIRSAIGQTWKRKEVIVVDDGSTDETTSIARSFESASLRVLRQEHQGAAAARNLAFQLSQGDYIQWLDADDLLARDKIERQLELLPQIDGARLLLSSAWAHFYFRTRQARFVPSGLWQDLAPVEWLLKKMDEHLHMPLMSWLVERRLAEAAGPWDVRLSFDDDGEYFCRVLLASRGTRFVSDSRSFYRITGRNSLSYLGDSDKKKQSLLLSMKLHIQYLRSLEDSERVRRACLRYLQAWYGNFYPERPDVVAELRILASQLRGELDVPHLRWKYAWMKPFFGWKAAKWAQRALPQLKASSLRHWDEAMFKIEARQGLGADT